MGSPIVVEEATKNHVHCMCVCVFVYAVFGSTAQQIQPTMGSFDRGGVAFSVVWLLTRTRSIRFCIG